MNKNVPSTKIIEGLTRLEIPKDYLNKKHFFNPTVQLSRDFTVLVLNTLGSKDWVVCDSLAGIGARGIRIAKECKVKEVWLNDISKENIPFMKNNIKLNSVEKKVKITNKDANQLLSDQIRKFDYIDIDPWGSPSYYFDAVARAIKRKGFIGFSATDTAALCGTSPMTCFRRYGIESHKTEFFKELGMRILITSAALAFSRWSFSFKPLLSYVFHHYFRVFSEVDKGKSIVNKTMKENLGYLSYCPRCFWRSVGEYPSIKCGLCKSKTSIIGKIWIGPIEDLRFIEECQKKLSKVDWLKTKDEIKKLLNFLKNENIRFYYDVHKLSQKHGLNIPKFDVLIDKLRERGYESKRTHFSYKGIKTDAPLNVIIDSIKSI